MLQFTFWDVQHGHACYINTPNNRHIAVDLGVGKYGGGKEFSPLTHLKANGVDQLDYVIITHPHRDHIDDIDAFWDLNPKTLLRPKHIPEKDLRSGNKPTDKPKIDRYLEVSNSFSSAVQAGSASDIFSPDQWGDMKFTSFHPNRCETTNLNNHSIVCIFEYAKSKILIPGDNEPASWKELLDRPGFIEASKDIDVFLAPHHGRKSAYCPELFEAIGKPKIFVISDGPEGETSATDLYGKQSQGYRVYYPDDTYEERYCVTTRKDGVVRVCAYFARDGSPRLNVFVQKGPTKPVSPTRRPI